MTAKHVYPSPKVQRIVSTTTTWELTPEQVEEAVRLFVEAPEGAEVRFSVGQVLRGATVTVREVE